MKIKFVKNLILVLSSLLLTNNVRSQTSYENNDYLKYYTLCKVWGYLKYNHPTVKKGKIDWDSELFRILKQVESAKTYNEINIIYKHWFESLDNNFRLKKNQPKESNNIFLKNYDISWINDSSFFTVNNAAYLNKVAKAKLKGKTHYVKQSHFITWFPNEQVYTKGDFPDLHIRLLALFRYWNIVEYYYAYKYESVENWDSSFVNLLPKFIHAKNIVDYHLAIKEMISSINDSHAYFQSSGLNNYFGRYRLPFSLQVIDSSMIVGNYLPYVPITDTIPSGSIINSINGKTFSNIYNSKKHLLSGSNFYGKLIYNGAILFFDSTNVSEISYTLSNGKKELKTISRFHVDSLNLWYEKYKKTRQELNNQSHRIIHDSIAYIDMGNLKVTEIKGIMKEIFEIKNLIIDLRRYPNGTIKELSKYLVEKGTPAQFLMPSINNPGKFVWSDSGVFGSNKKNIYKGKIVVLVGHLTKSQGEFSTMILQMRKDVTIVGSQTAGADGAIAKIHFPSGEESNITGYGVYYPDKTPTQRVGIKIDILVNPSLLSTSSNEDEVLNEALKIIYSKNE